MDEEKELLRQQLEQMSMKLAELDAALTAERALRTAAVARAKMMELDVALASWVAAEQSLEVIAGSSTERDAEYATAEYLAAALGEDYLAAERALRVSTEAATPPDVTSAEELEATKRPAVKQQPLQQPSTSSSRGATGGGVHHMVGGGFGPRHAVLVQGRCGQRRMVGEFGPEGDIRSPLRPGETERGYDDAASPRRSAGYAGWGVECEG